MTIFGTTKTVNKYQNTWNKMKLFEAKSLGKLKEGKEAKPYIKDGMKYKSAIWFDSDKEANGFMSKNPKYGALATVGEQVVVAKIDDKGIKTNEKLKESASSDMMGKMRSVIKDRKEGLTKAVADSIKKMETLNEERGKLLDSLTGDETKDKKIFAKLEKNREGFDDVFTSLKSDITKVEMDTAKGYRTVQWGN